MSDENEVGRRRIDSARRTTRRCGICQEVIHPGEPTLEVDDERCHYECAEEVDG